MVFCSFVKFFWWEVVEFDILCCAIQECNVFGDGFERWRRGVNDFKFWEDLAAVVFAFVVFFLVAVLVSYFVCFFATAFGDFGRRMVFFDMVLEFLDYFVSFFADNVGAGEGGI